MRAFRRFVIAVALAALAAPVASAQRKPESRPASRPTTQKTRPPFTNEGSRSVTADPLVMDALDWLARHQSKEGAFEADGFHGYCSQRFTETCDGPGIALYTNGVTGLALLAFLNAGIDGTADAPLHHAVKRGLAWLRATQDERGCFGPNPDTRFVYWHAIGTLGMCEAFRATRDPDLRKAAQAGLKHIAELRNPGRAWRYGERPKDNDSSVTGWMLRALAAGRDAGLQVDGAAIDEGLAYLDEMTDPETGRTGYVRQGELPVRFEQLVPAFPPQYTESLTALAIACRVTCSSDPARQRRFLPKSVPLLLKNLPAWDQAKGTIDLYYWYYGSIASYHVGKELWHKWEPALRRAATAGVRKTGCPKGSFNPADPWSPEGGRVYATAMMALALEAAYQGERRLK